VRRPPDMFGQVAEFKSIIPLQELTVEVFWLRSVPRQDRSISTKLSGQQDRK
jgi:hypothetical protein